MTMTAPAPSTGCRLVAVDGRVLPLRAVEVDADAGGGLASVRLAQTFTNAFPEPLRATYTLPLPADGAVVGFAYTIDGARTVGVVARREDARAAFEQALIEGRTAAILEQERSALFTQELGNVPPGATVVVEVTVEQVLRFAEGGWEWRWPTVVGPRYLGGQTPHGERVTIDVAEGLVVPCAAQIAVRDEATGPPSSPSHAFAGSDVVQITGALDRDLVVRWPVAAPEVGARLEVARPAADPHAYGWLTLVPPARAGRRVARDLCLLLDTSGSMSGAPLAQLQAFARGLVGGLRAGDRLEMIEFSSHTRRWREAPAPIDDGSRADALAWIASRTAGGGTEMVTAIVAALAPLRAEAERQVVLVTDGFIGFEDEVLRQIRAGLPAGSRLHTVAIGSAPNRTLTAGAARAGAGHEAFVGPDEAADAAVAELLARTGDPLWVDVRIGGSALVASAPATVPDVLAGAPARIALRLRPEGGELTITALTAEGQRVERLAVGPVAAGSGRRVVATRFARERVEDLELARACGEVVDAEVEQLGLAHQIATRLTSWVAIGPRAVDPGDPTRTVNVPHALPYGVSAQGVGLRAAAMPGAAFGRAMLANAPAMPMPHEPIALERRRGGPGGAPARPAPVATDKRKAAREQADELVLRQIVPARPRLRAVIRRRDGGKLVIEVVVDGLVRWDPAAAVAIDADGRQEPVAAEEGTTRAGPVGAGQTVRLVIAWSGADPARIELPDLILEVA